MKKFHNNIAANDQSEFSFNHEVTINNQASLVKPTSLLALSLTATHSLATPTTPAVLLETNIDFPTHVNHEKIIQPELMIIDSRLENIDNLIERRRKGLIPIIVKQDQSGLDAISQAMLKYPDAQTIHVISHGEPGKILLGNSAIDEDQLNTQTGAFHQWRNDKVLARPDLIVYGCNVAKGQVGQDFVNRLSLVTGFDVAASTDLTGQANLGGDWDLETSTGWIDASLAWQENDIKQIQGVLATITVNSLLDSGAGTLRDALDNLVADGDTIDFSATGTIVLASELTIANSITITGPGAANLSIDGDDNFRVMDINIGLNVTISDVTITRGFGNNGGGIRSYASYLTISNSVISYNSAAYSGGGINQGYANSSLTLSNVTMENNSANLVDGGAINTYIKYGSLSITDSIISNNQANYDGGAINLSSDYTSTIMTNVTLNNNNAGADGGAINLNSDYTSTTLTNITLNNNTSKYGGGLKVDGQDHSLTIRDSNLTNNSASYNGGGLSFGNEYNDLLIDNTTITGNYAGDDGGGVYIYIDDYNGYFTIQNSTISNNTADGNGGGIAVYADSVRQSDGYKGSLLIDNVIISGNFANGDGGGIWLYGEEDFIPTTIQNSTITDNYSYRDGGGVFFQNDYGSATLDISNTTISNNTAYSDGGGIQLQHETYGSDITITDSTISGNQANNGDGGGINVYHEEELSSAPYGSLTITNTQITGNTAYNNGGGISLLQGYGYGYQLSPLTINGGSISNNTATNGNGGGVNIRTGGYVRDIDINDTTIDGNTAEGDGGGFNLDVYAYGINGSVNILNSTISNNTSNEDGGGVSLLSDGGSTINIINSTISGNTANDGASRGGGLFVGSNTNVDLISSTVNDNYAYIGGGIFVDGDMDIENSIVSNNNSNNYLLTDGNIFNNGSNLSLESSLISTYVSGGYIGIGGNLINVNPTLGPLQDNGGPTLTHQLLAGSPAINAGDNALNSQTFDQRGMGFDRILDTTIDMGAIEGPFIEVSLSIAGSPLAENGGVATVTATANAAPAVDVLVDLVLTGTAGAGDFSASATQITIPAGMTTGSITLTGIDDTTDEPDETIIVDIDMVSGGGEAGGMQQVTATITDDDDAPTASLTLSGSPLAENAGVATVSGTLSEISSFVVTIDLGFTGTATNAVDYTPSTAQLSIPAGMLSSDMTLTSIDDILVEGDETIVVDITGTTMAVAGGSVQVTAIITDDDAPPPQATVSLSSVQVLETAGVVTYTINLDGPAPVGGVTIDLAFSGTATDGVDYTASSMQIVILAGATSGNITFTIIDDGIVEPTETIIIEVTGITNATVNGSPTAILSILGTPAVIPSLSSWSTLLLSLLLPAFVMRRFRKRKTVEITYQ